MVLSPVLGFRATFGDAWLATFEWCRCHLFIPLLIFTVGGVDRLPKAGHFICHAASPGKRGQPPRIVIFVAPMPVLFLLRARNCEPQGPRIVSFPRLHRVALTFNLFYSRIDDGIAWQLAFLVFGFISVVCSRTLAVRSKTQLAGDCTSHPPSTPATVPSSALWAPTFGVNADFIKEDCARAWNKPKLHQCGKKGTTRL